ncbi:MAG: hypothetical protein JO159_13580 [Acidobacteria bacterium]|nr:hypothetical protein [Acidobacteriota bacterium]
MFFFSGFGFFSGGFVEGGFDTDDDPGHLYTPPDTATSMTSPESTEAPAAEEQNPPHHETANLDADGKRSAKSAQKGPFVLILKNGTEWVVNDYWLEQGYIEFVTYDKARRHVPLDAVDVQKTVTENSARGVPFTLRSAARERQ